MPIYSCDSSAFLDGWVRHYPPDTFPVVWEQMSRLIGDGQLLFVDEVARELKRKDDGAYQWVADRDNSIVAIDGLIQDAVTEILRDHQRLLDTRRNKSGADPFVIALARVRACSVLTGEQSTGSLERPKIPDVCSVLTIPCVSLVQMFRDERLVFA
jgi:hypothetical protein